MRTRLLQGVGTLSVVGGTIAIWYAFQRQMCTNVAGGANSCAPNIAYLLPGVLAVLVGVGLFAGIARRDGFGKQPSDET